MKAYKEPAWQFESTGVEGNATLFGVNIFDYEWTNTDMRARIETSLDGSFAFLPIYAVVIDGSEYQFACEERNNCVYNFYVYRY